MAPRACHRMVFWREGTGGHTGRLVLGEEADVLSSRAPWCLERTPKRRIGDEYLLLGEQQVRMTDAIGAILRKAAEEAVSRRGGEGPERRAAHASRALGRPRAWTCSARRRARRASTIPSSCPSRWPRHCTSPASA